MSGFRARSRLGFRLGLCDGLHMLLGIDCDSHCDEHIGAAFKLSCCDCASIQILALEARRYIDNLVGLVAIVSDGVEVLLDLVGQLLDGIFVALGLLGCLPRLPLESQF